MAGSRVLLIGILLPALVVLLLAGRTRVGDRDLSWIAGAATVSGDEAEIYRRYLVRHRRHRLLGGMLGVTVAVVVGIQYYGTVQLIGAGDVSPFADVFFCAVAGTVLGALSAETYRLAQPRGTVAAASLAPREPVGLPRVVVPARVLAGLGVVWGAVVLAVTGDGAGLGVGLFGVALAGLAEATRAAVAGRRRPVRSAQAVRVDSRIRAFAGRSVSWLQLSAATLTATWAASLTPTADSLVLGWLLVVVVIGGLVAAVVFLRRAAPRPARTWRPREVLAT